MFLLLLTIIYLAFISLGLPDSLLGSAWPTMYPQFGASLSDAGTISTVISLCTIVSSLASDRINRKLGTGLVTAISTAMTAVALFGFSLSHSVWELCLWAIPYGLGAGGVDAALNNYVALHYSSRHMSWLHCFWGVGASISPYIMSYALGTASGWQGGYRTVGGIQAILSIALFAALPVWRIQNRAFAEASPEEPAGKSLSLGRVLRIPGVIFILLAFFGDCALEMTAGLWASSYLVEFRGVDGETAALFASLYYLGITAGRFLNGFVANRLGDRRMIRIGILVMAAGAVMIALPQNAVALAGLLVVGLGCAPVYPSIIHSTPANFGRENSQAIVGIQMASAYCGSTLAPLVFGWIAQAGGIGLYPLYLGCAIALMLCMTEIFRRRHPVHSTTDL